MIGLSWFKTQKVQMHPEKPHLGLPHTGLLGRGHLDLDPPGDNYSYEESSAGKRKSLCKGPVAGKEV